MIRRRNSIEPAIGYMKTDGKLDPNQLKGALGDAMHSGAVRRRPHPAEAAAYLPFAVEMGADLPGSTTSRTAKRTRGGSSDENV